ncbi:MAG: hypothetical protein HYS12_10785 [Planctomycetes bacterium]|nr:hypothetical protein [Planctomycetota bacterium]
MPSAFRNQKNLKEWLELDYYQRPRGLRRWRNRLTLLLLVLCVVGVAGAIFLLPRSARLVQAGPVTSAHSIVHDCERCHQEAFLTAKKLLPGNAGVRVVPDEACIQCHDGPAHNQVQDNPEEVRCATCHREHRGRSVLARVPDGDCTACHADLKGHRKGGREGLAFKDVHAFNDDHPEFRLRRTNPDGQKASDEAKILFNHEHHLVELKKLGDRFERLAEPLKKLREQGCVRCHEPDAAGRYMRPVNYEAHCAECHPLSVQLAGEFRGEGPREDQQIKQAVEEFNRKPAPHKEPRVVRAELRERLLSFVQRFPVVPDEDAPMDRLVDEGVFGKRPTREQWKWVKRKLDSFEGVLFAADKLEGVQGQLLNHSCNHCHIEKKGERGGAGLPVFEKTNIPDRWLTHARFSHQHHRMLNCTECHDAPVSSKTADILMPSVGSCQKCHNPDVGVRNDCVECHNYHDRRHTREIHKNFTIDKALSK